MIDLQYHSKSSLGAGLGQGNPNNKAGESRESPCWSLWYMLEYLGRWVVSLLICIWSGFFPLPLDFGLGVGGLYWNERYLYLGTT